MPSNLKKRIGVDIGRRANGFRSLDDVVRGRDYLVAEAKAVGVPSAQ